MTICRSITRGSIYSRKGGNRYEPCTFPAKFHIVGHPRDIDVCGVHVRAFRIFNERLWRTDDVLRRPRRACYYAISPLEPK